MNIGTTTDAVASTGTTAKTADTASAKVSGDYQMFLKMLTAQMRNQDPLNPIDSTDYATQLATFSGVEQQVRTNELLANLAGQMGVSGMGQLAGWVGMEGRAAVPARFDGQPVTLFPEPAKGADRTVLVAYDAQGREATRQEIPVGTDPVNWTGRSDTGGEVMHGDYTFRLESSQGGKVIANDKVSLFARIAEVRQGEAGAVLVFDGGATALPSEVKALRPAGAAAG